MQIDALRRGGAGGEAHRRWSSVASETAADTCSSSSIGKASESGSTFRFGFDGSDESEEVQSPYKGPLGAMHALEESLPIRRGISRFYDGRSKSFGNLTASVSPSNSCKDLAKAENPYTRKRKNILSFSLMYQPRTEKALPARSCSKSSLTSSDSESNISGLEEETPSKRVKNPISVFLLHQRSISLTDLQGVSIPNSPTN